MNVVLRLTRSQQMALTSIVSAYARQENEPQDFVDVVRDVTTTTGELLSMVATEGAYEQDETLAALAESVKLQSHYAEQLNVWDGGQRKQFASAAEWMERICEPRPAAEAEAIAE